jgi:hypothetical protein
LYFYDKLNIYFRNFLIGIRKKKKKLIQDRDRVRKDVNELKEAAARELKCGFCTDPALILPPTHELGSVKTIFGITCNGVFIDRNPRVFIGH